MLVTTKSRVLGFGLAASRLQEVVSSDFHKIS